MSNEYDSFVAILELRDPLADFTRELRPICLPAVADRSYHFTHGRLAGWGWTGQDWTSTLKEVEATIWPQWFCKWVMQQYWIFNRKDWHSLTA